LAEWVRSPAEIKHGRNGEVVGSVFQSKDGPVSSGRVASVRHAGFRLVCCNRL